MLTQQDIAAINEFLESVEYESVTSKMIKEELARKVREIKRKR